MYCKIFLLFYASYFMLFSATDGYVTTSQPVSLSICVSDTKKEAVYKSQLGTTVLQT
jgi:hypothetical protein